MCERFGTSPSAIPYRSPSIRPEHLDSCCGAVVWLTDHAESTGAAQEAADTRPSHPEERLVCCSRGSWAGDVGTPTVCVSAG